MLAVSGAVLAAAGAGCDSGGDSTPADAASAGTGGAAPVDAAMPPIDASAHSDAAVDAASDAAPSVDAAADADAAPDAASDAGDAGSGMPETLADTGLYAPGSTSELAAGVLAYEPRYELWSDGAQKQRWLLLPEGAQIDTSDMDAWRFPVGTKIWKEFARDGRRLETRMIWKTDEGWQRMAFVWNDDESAAVAAPRGQRDVRGTTHDVPRRTACGECHDGQPDFALGVSAIQLAHDRPGLTLATLIADSRLSDPPASDVALPDGADWDALGYLHANCGSCHNPHSLAWDRVNLDLWLRTAELAAIEGTQSYQTTVGVALTDTSSALSLRIAAGDAAMSGIVLRMNTRGDETAMPPLASEQVDEDGVALVSSFIEGL